MGGLPLALWCAATTAAVVVAAAPVDPLAPRQVHLAPTEHHTALLVSWVTGTPDWAGRYGSPQHAAPVAPAVRLGAAPGVYDRTIRGNYSVIYNNTGNVIHRVNMTGLAPSTAYYYVVGDAVLGNWSAEFSFRSPTAPSPSAPTNLLVLADMGTDRATAGVVQRDLGALVASGAVAWDMLLFPGDLSYAGTSGLGNITRMTQLWDLFFDGLQPFASSVPIAVAPGNHDVNVSTGDTSGGECGVAMVRGCTAQDAQHLGSCRSWT